MAGHLDPPAMLLHDLLHDGQADPRARLSGVFRLLRAIEFLKNLFENGSVGKQVILHGLSDPVFSSVKTRPAVL